MIIIELAKRLGLPWTYTHPSEVFAELKQAGSSLENITWDRLERESAIIYPCPEPDHPGEPVVFGNGFPTESGRAHLVPADMLPPAEVPDQEYSLVLMTGRQLEHWNTGAMTRRADVLDSLEPSPTASLHPNTLARHDIAPGDLMRITTRRGSIELTAAPIWPCRRARFLFRLPMWRPRPTFSPIRGSTPLARFRSSNTAR